jgi:putative PIG3 family NAD(P)H quinone oxidoreductase
MQKMMQHIVIDGFGDPEVLKMSEGPRPIVRAGEVLIRVAAAGVNRPDCSQRRGSYPPPPGVTDIPGLEVAGRIAAVGDGATGFHVGDRVCALVAGGGYAEYVAVPAPQVLPIPDGMDDATAAAIPETYFTVWANVFQLGALKPGESLLVHGGASGIGTTAIQLASALGSRVYATVRSPEKAAACERIGAEAAVDYTAEDFVERIMAMTDGAGVDVILDMRGGAYMARNIHAAATGGRLISIASLAGKEGTVDIPLMMRKRLTITGSTLRARPVAEKGAIAAELSETVWPLFERGEIRPQVSVRLPLTDAARAHALLEANDVIGKIVLCMDE